MEERWARMMSNAIVADQLLAAKATNKMTHLKELTDLGFANRKCTIICFNWQSFARIDRKHQCRPLMSHHAGGHVIISGQSLPFPLGSLHPGD